MPEIRILAPSLERGLDEVPVQPRELPTATFIEPETKLRKERYTHQMNDTLHPLFKTTDYQITEESLDFLLLITVGLSLIDAD